MKTRKKDEAATDEITILERVLSNGEGFPVALARQLVKLEFSEEDETRMHDLAIRNQAGELTPKERQELHSYANAGCLLGILQLKARQALKQSPKK
jgi:hypothetical protein